MAQMGDITVRIRAVDEVTPALKRIRRRMWFMQYGDAVVTILAGLLAVAAFVLGRLTA